MGANNCKSLDHVQETMDDYFNANYARLVVVGMTGMTGGTSYPFLMPTDAIMFLINEIFMLQLGDLVNCAIEYNTLGPDTASRFTDMSADFYGYAIGTLIYGLFIETPLLTLIGTLIAIITPLTLGIGAILFAFFPIYWVTTRSLMMAANLYWGNVIYTAFYPVVAP